MIPLKYLSNFWKTLGIPFNQLCNNLDLNWSKKCVIVASNADQETTFLVTYTKLYVPVESLSTQVNAKLF